MKVKLVAHLPGLSEISNSLERHSRCLLLLGEGVANLPRSGVEKGGGGGGGCANANAHFRDGASRAKLHCLGRVCAERSEIVRIFNEARAKRVKRVKRIKWNGVSLVLDVAFMPACSHFAHFIASMLVFLKARSLRSLTFLDCCKFGGGVRRHNPARLRTVNR